MKKIIQNNPCFSRDFFKRYGLIKPQDDYIFNVKEDGGDLKALYGDKNTRDKIDGYLQDMKTINSRCRGSKNPDNHLPKGFFQPNDQYNPSKPTFVISVTSDPASDLPDLLRALDAYFKMNIPEVKKITNKFNVIVAWSATMMDTYKTLQLVKQQLADKFNEAKSLFISGKRLHDGSADFYTEADINNPDSYAVASTMFDSPDSGIKKYRFIESSYCNNDSRFIENWKSDLQGSIVELLKRFRVWKGWTTISKLCFGLDINAIKKNEFTLEDIAGIHVPVQAAAKSLEMID